MSVLSAGNPSAAKASWLRCSSQSGSFRQPRLWRTRVCCAPSAVMSWQAQSGRQALHSLSQHGRWQGHNEGISNLEADIWQAHTNVVHVQRHCCQQQGALREAVSAASPARSQVCFCSAVMELNRANIDLCLSSFAGRPASQCAGRPPRALAAAALGGSARGPAIADCSPQRRPAGLYPALCCPGR